MLALAAKSDKGEHTLFYSLLFFGLACCGRLVTSVFSYKTTIIQFGEPSKKDPNLPFKSPLEEIS